MSMTCDEYFNKLREFESLSAADVSVWNAVIEEATKIMDAKSAALSAAADNTHNRIDCVEFRAGALLCLTAAVEIRALKRE